MTIVEGWTDELDDSSPQWDEKIKGFPGTLRSPL